MKITYTLHAEEKLKRAGIKRLKITKKLIGTILENPEMELRTKYGDYSAVSKLDLTHDIRLIYAIIPDGIRLITFHVSKKGRYR